jgi:hypothetical protein
MSDERRSDPELKSMRGYNGPKWFINLIRHGSLKSPRDRE